ncbi:hypothetical protein HG536_0G04010 [Torulaspora globosa]|uniref:C2H2-type domain-containing protein n=1 Tax=Torulaspora globosa TaxID=48254 RepID=A0A7G3ZM03_9SACH|nr:uncharacterized protein HG536_0G04010 [Torulaspora globosa]QLL34539.1 hypothetical protein HG536_0G04010 [Torulaspora globosa]
MGELGRESSHQTGYGVHGHGANHSVQQMSSSESGGRFKCPHPACDKSFTRQEHLSRHKLNHWPKEIFKCSYVFPNTGLVCNRTFVRKDLLARHVKRHTKTGSRLQNNTVPIGDEFVSRTAGAAGSAPPVLLPQQSIGFAGQSAGPLPTGEGVPMPPELQLGAYPVQQYGRQTRPNSQEYGTAASGSRLNNSEGSQNVSQFFNWLFENGAGSAGQQANYSSNSVKNSLTSSPLPTSSGGTSEQPLPIGNVRNASSATQPFSPTGNQFYQNPGPLFPEGSPSARPLQGSQEPIATSASLTKMQDLFSIDFLTNDPLQTFMQELSETAVPSQDHQAQNEGNFSSSSVSPTHSDLMARANPRLSDRRRNSVKDNLLVQKSNIAELQRQTSNEKRIANSPNYKQRVLSSMKMVPSFFHSDPATKYNLSSESYEKIIQIVPELREVSLDDLRMSLRSFWCNFHPQLGLLHKPSFHIDQQPPILTLALIMAGASFLSGHYRETISDVICTPLRWIIFSHEDFQPPSKTYIIQSLLLLEGYEKTSTNRYLHERSYLHHGTTLQLLRRTPSFGGHPLILKTEQDPTGLQDPQEVYRRWIDFEMLKRVAFYAFYMDTTHAAIFGYLNLFINCNQIQLTLPCSDSVWESYDLSYEVLLEQGFEKERRTFLCTLKQLMGEIIQNLQNASDPSKKEKSYELKSWEVNSVFGKKILLAGIISTMFQCQESNEGDLFATTIKCNLGKEKENISWQDVFSFAMDYWLYQIQGSCTETKYCLIDPFFSQVGSNPEENAQSPGMASDIFSINSDVGCKIPEYHMAQVILRIYQYDYYIYSGAPWRMNVRSGNEEYNLVSKRISQFASDPRSGGVAMIYAYQFMFQMFIDKKTGGMITKPYDVNSDFCITRPNTVALLALLIWSYNFSLYGPEAHVWDNKEPSPALNDGSPRDLENSSSPMNLYNKRAKESYVPKESFEAYLTRMYRLLNVEDSSDDVISYHNNILSKALVLQTIPGTNNLCGMMIFMKQLFENSYWDLGREFSKLFDNCLERSMGKAAPICESMYKV